MLKKKSLITLVSLLVILCVSVGGSLAYLVTTSDPVTNTFTPTSVTTEVLEKFDNNKKTEVKIKNTGSTDAYIRAAVVVTWQNDQGEVYGKQPVAGTDYSISYNIGNQTNPEGKWVENGGFYYWNKSVASGEFTGTLINSCSPLAPCENTDYTLSVEIIGSGVQSKGMGTDANGNPAKPVVLAWGIDPTTLGK